MKRLTLSASVALILALMASLSSGVSGVPPHKTPKPRPSKPVPTVVVPTPTPTVPSSGFVTKSGTSLSLDGRPFVFTGINIYNANSRWNCWYPLGYNDSALANSLTAIGSGKEVFRAWFFQSLATDWAAFDHTLSVARTYGQRAVVVLMNNWGTCDGGQRRFEDWYANGYKTSFRSYVQQIVTRYRNEPAIAMWQIGNELEIVRADGSCGSNAVMQAFVQDISELIKSIDNRHLLSIGTMGSGQCGTSTQTMYETLHALPTIDICEYHDYGRVNEPMPGDQWNGMATRLNQCNAMNKPFFVGEVGIEASNPNRASLMEDKLSAQIGAGIDGFLAWEWDAMNHVGGPGDEFVIGPNDPVLAVLGR